MSAGKHTPGRQCDECEGHCLQPVARVVEAGAMLSLHIGQHVRHHDYNGTRVTGVVCGLMLDEGCQLMADIVLDTPIIVPARGGFSETRIHRQNVPAHELAPFDDRDELISALLAVARMCEQRLTTQKWVTDGPREALAPEALLLVDLRAVIAKASTQYAPRIAEGGAS